MRVVLAILVVLVTAVPARAQLYAPPPGRPPAICAGDAFVDLVGTSGNDTLQAPNRATRVWGLGGADRLIGSTTRASCLLGGAGNDVLLLNGGGGVAYGNRGRDVLLGSDLGDILDGGREADGILAGGGDDKITSRDGHPEYVDCGAGADIVKGDRADLLINCESMNLAGKPGLHLAARPRKTFFAGSVRFTLPVAKAGDYRVLYLNSCRTSEPGEVARLSASKAGRRVRVRVPRPTFGWCRGTVRLGVVRDPGYSLPLVPVARLSFTVR